MADYTVNYSPTVYEVYVSDGGARTYSDLAVTAHNADATAHAIQVNAQTGTTYQLVLADAGKVVQCTNVNPIALTVPLNATVAFAVGTVIGLRQGGAGLLTVAAAGGVTLSELTGGRPTRRYLGYDVVIDQTLPTTTSTINNVPMLFFGDLRLAATMGERRGIRVKTSDDRYFEYDQIGIQATERVDIVVHDLGDNTTAGPLVALIGNT